MTEVGNGNFIFPRRLIEVWYLLSQNLSNCNCQSAKSESMPFDLRLIRNHGYLITLVGIGSMVAIQCRSALITDSSGAWRWAMDLASPLHNAMALSEFAPRFEVSTKPEILVSFPENRCKVCTLVGEPFDAKKAIELLSLTWVPLPLIAGEMIKQVVNQLEKIITNSYEDARLLLGNRQITLQAQQRFPTTEETVAEFDLVETNMTGLSFSIPRILLTSMFVQPIETYRLALCAAHQFAALILSDDCAIVFKTNVETITRESSFTNSGVPLIPGLRDELFALLHPVETRTWEGSHSWFDNFDDLFLEAIRYLLTTHGEPCATFSIDVDGTEFFEVARFHYQDEIERSRWFDLNMSHRHSSQALHKICQEVQRETKLEMEGKGIDQDQYPYVTGSFPNCLSPLDLRQIMRQVLFILWGSVPQVFSRIEWRNLDKRYSGSATVLKRHVERKRFESVRFDRDRQPREYIKALYDNHCQICGHKIVGSDGTAYSEVHHIRFLNQNGPDIVGNMLVLCPTHHKEFDLSVLALDPDSCPIISAYPTHPLHGKAVHVLDEHRLDRTCLEWARTFQKTAIG